MHHEVRSMPRSIDLEDGDVNSFNLGLGLEKIRIVTKIFGSSRGPGAYIAKGYGRPAFGTCPSQSNQLLSHLVPFIPTWPGPVLLFHRTGQQGLGLFVGISQPLSNLPSLRGTSQKHSGEVLKLRLPATEIRNGFIV